MGGFKRKGSPREMYGGGQNAGHPGKGRGRFRRRPGSGGGPQVEPIYVIHGGPGFSKTGTWLSSSLTSYNGSPTEYTQTIGDTATWAPVQYVPVNGNYDVAVWYPTSASNAATVEYTITTPAGTWVRTVNQQSGGGNWVKLATVTGQAGAGLTVKVKALVGGGGSNNTRTGAVRITYTTQAAEPTGSASAGQDTTNVVVFVNQTGYDLNRPKRATVTNVPDGTAFSVRNAADNSEVYPGTVTKQIADFSSFNPSTSASTQYYVQCGAAKSDNFKINRFLMQRASAVPALKFMVESRSDTWKAGLNSIAWRDSHQFSFEIPSLVMQYMANPALYERLPYGVTHLSDSKFTELRTQAEPDIVWLMKFGAMTYYDLVVNKAKKIHALTKAQLAFFLYLYPEISQYVTNTFYTQIRDMTVAQWADPNVSSDVQWYDVGTSTDNNLLATQSVIGGIKGAQPPGYAILPNLLMYEVATRDGLANPQQYMDAAVANATWLVNSVDLLNPLHTKGQRMSEHVTLTALGWLLEKYPAQAPAGTQAKIDALVDRLIKRSDNLWDYRKYADTTAGDSISQWTGDGTSNEPGNIVGFPAVALAARRVSGTTAQKTRLLELAVSHIDHAFGRNPFGRHFCHDAATEIEGVERGWAVEYEGGAGAGDLHLVPAAIEGSPKESAYPFAPTADPGYTEGWVAFNAAWNISLAYSAADDVEVKVYDSTFTTETASAPAGTTLGIQLKAPLNLDPTAVETGKVWITTSGGAKSTVTVTERSVDDYYFRGTYVVPNDGSTYVDISYGFGLFRKAVRLTVGAGGEPPADTTAPEAPTNLAYGTPTTTTIPLTWTASVSSDVVGYRIEYGANVINTGSTGTSYTVTGLTPNTSYTFTVKALDAVPNVSAASNAVTVSTAQEPAQADYARDNFNSKSGTTGLGVDETGKTWQIRSGAGGVGSTDTINAYFSSANSLATIPSGASDCNVEVEYRATGTNNTGGRIIFRYVSSTDFWFVENTSTGPALKKLVGGTFTTLGSTTTPIVQGDVIRVQLSGSNITVYRNGVVEIATVTDSAHSTSTHHGIGVAGATTARFDNFRVYP